MTLLLTLEEAAAFLNPTITTAELSECITKLAIPEIEIGSKIFYCEDDLKCLINCSKKQEQLITKESILCICGSCTIITEHENGDLEWQDTGLFAHLARNGVELTYKIKATKITLFEDQIWAWKDIYGWWHLIQSGTELTDGIDAKDIKVFSDTPYWAYQDSDDWWHLIQDGTELTDGISAKDVKTFSETPCWAYQDVDDWWHLIQDGTELTDGISAKDVIVFSEDITTKWAYKNEDGEWVDMET